MSNVTFSLICGLGVLLIPLRVFALEDTTPRLIQWIIVLIEIIVLVIALFQVIPAIVYRARYKKIARLPADQVNEELKNQATLFARKAKLRLKLLIVFGGIFVLLFAGWLVYNASLSYSARVVISDPCKTNLGWDNTPCTAIRDAVTTEMVKTMSQGYMNILSWNTGQGRIYWAGMVSSDDLYDCDSMFAVTDGTFGTYYNARGEEIASCSSGYYKNPKICNWLMKLELSDADYSDPECSKINSNSI